LSEISPDNPVLLTHASGHASFVNAKTMELAGVTKSTPDPPGGRILRTPDGNPAGVFLETAEELIYKKVEEIKKKRSPEQIEMEMRKVVELAVQECLSRGVTSFQDAGATFENIELYKKLAAEDRLGIRLWVMIIENNEQLRQHISEYKIIGMSDNRLTVRGIKRIMDGALGSRGAWLLEPYSDLPNSVGLNTTPLKYITETAQIAIENGFQLCTHAIGDRANRETLNIYESVFKEHPGKNDLRWRIEHAQHINVSDIPRFANLDVIASMQGIHCTSDGPWVIKRLGEKRAEEGAYVWQKLMKSGAIVINGTDSPVESLDPLANFYASVTRKLQDGTLFNHLSQLVQNKR
jgi:predicted amidohydrolase YtcJ